MCDEMHIHVVCYGYGYSFNADSHSKELPIFLVIKQGVQGKVKLHTCMPDKEWERMSIHAGYDNTDWDSGLAQWIEARALGSSSGCPEHPLWISSHSS